MIRKPKYRLIHNMYSDGITDPLEISKRLGVTEETAKREIAKFSDPEAYVREWASSTRSSNQEWKILLGAETLVDIPQDPRIYLDDPRLAKPIYSTVRDNIDALEDVNVLFSTQPRRELYKALGGQAKVKTYLQAFGLTLSDMPLSPQAFTLAIDTLKGKLNFEVLEKVRVSSKYELPRNVLFKGSIDSLEVRCVTQKSSLKLTDTSIVDAMLSSDGPFYGQHGEWILFSRYDDLLDPSDWESMKVFTLVGIDTEKDYEDFMLNTLLWLVGVFPELRYCGLRTLSMVFTPEVVLIHDIVKYALSQET